METSGATLGKKYQSTGFVKSNRVPRSSASSFVKADVANDELIMGCLMISLLIFQILLVLNINWLTDIWWIFTLIPVYVILVLAVILFYKKVLALLEPPWFKYSLLALVVATSKFFLSAMVCRALV